MIDQILDNINLITDRPLSIVETGCSQTKAIARWVRENPEAEFENVSLDINLQASIHAELSSEGLSKFCEFHTQTPSKALSKKTWLDVAVLYPATLQEGVEQFQLAASAGASHIIMIDYQTRAALAVRYAKDLGWKFEVNGLYCILKRGE